MSACNEDQIRILVCDECDKLKGDQAMNYVITIDKEHNGDAWWTAYNATLHPDPRARDIQRVDSIMSQVRNNKSAVIPGDELDVFIEWAESLPGWNDGPEHAPHPLLINEWEA